MDRGRLLAVAGVGVVLWFTAKALRPWTPNIVVGAITAAVTITIIDCAIRGEAQRRLKRRVEDVLHRLGSAFKGFVSAVIVDYSGSHLASFTSAWPR